MSTKTKTRRMTKKVPKDPNQRNIPKLFPPRKTLRKSLARTYYPVTDHIYYDGHSFRVRVRKDGNTISWNTADKAKAIEYRDFLLLAK
jgi:hypothetical protein